MFGRRADERDAGLHAALGEVGSLAQESVARVDGIAAVGLGQSDDAGGVEVGSWAGGVQRQRFVGVTYMGRLGIVLRIHRDAHRAQVPHRAHQAQGDLPAIGDQNLPEHQAISLQGSFGPIYTAR